MITLLSLAQVASILPLSAMLVFALAKLLSRRRHGGQRGPVSGGVLITGCDSGFGQQLALRLDRQGWVVFAGCLFPEGDGARSLEENCSANLKILQLDVSSEEEVQNAKRTVMENLPENGLWAVVNNAGITDWAEIEWSNMEDYQHMLEVNLLGSIRVSLAFLPLVRLSKGRMVFVSSILAFFHCLNMSAYSVSKRGLEAFADCLRVEMASFGVKVSIVQPGNFGRATSIVKSRTAAELWEKLGEERRKTFNREYLDLAVDYYSATCRSGFEDPDRVIQALLHAVTSPWPRPRYLLVSAMDYVFFKLVPMLPSAVTDAVFTVSNMYAKRRDMLYAK